MFILQYMRLQFMNFKLSLQWRGGLEAGYGGIIPDLAEARKLFVRLRGFEEIGIE
jgi:hypothetical protein